ncbi:MAG TPA: hypothetical protein VH475_07115 [Tepidisphaeraceae bacterium]|jgi:hypothetical protein
MQRWRGKPGVGRGLIVIGLTVGILSAVSPCARGLIRRLVQDSLEVQVAQADLVIRGRLLPLRSGPPEDSAVTGVEVLEVLKGAASPGETVRLQPDPVMIAISAGSGSRREGLFALRRSTWVEKKPGKLYAPCGSCPLGVYLFDDTRLLLKDAWDAQPDAQAFSMDGRRLTDARELMLIARKAAAFSTAQPGGEPQDVTLEASLFPDTSPIAHVRFGMLRVPVDARLERMGMAWVDESDVRYRARAAEVLACFTSAESRRVLKRLMSDPGYELEAASAWEPRRADRVQRQYLARAAAFLVFARQHEVTGPADATGPHVAYRPLSVWPVAGIVAAMIALPALSGRRGGVRRRIVVWGLLMAAAGVAVLAWRSRALPEALSWGIARTSFELVSARGELWLLQVDDGAAERSAAVRSELVLSGERPWFAGLLEPAHEAGAARFYGGRGTVARTPFAYRLVRAPYAAVAGALMIVPAWAGAGRLWRSVRSRRRLRRGWCVACGYDLRASPGRCPECGRWLSIGAHARTRPASRPAKPGARVSSWGRV